MRARYWFQIRKLTKPLVIYFNNIKQALQNDAYLCNTFYVIMLENSNSNWVIYI